VQQRQRQKRRRPQPNLKKHLRILKHIAILIVTVFALYYFSQSSFFSLQRIEVQGIVHLKPNQVNQESGLNIGANIFKLDLAQAQRRLLAHPLIEQVELQRHYPHSVVIRLVERQPRAVLLAGSVLMVIDHEGYCIDRTNNLATYSLPIITGIRPDRTGLGQQVSSNQNLVPVLVTINGEVENFFSEFNLSRKDLVIAYSRDGVPILLGTTDKLQEKLKLAISFVSSLSSTSDIEYVDIRAAQAPAVKYRGSGAIVKEKLLNSG
jgi:cell division protein FtsQ